MAHVGFEKVMRRIESACSSAGRAPDEVRLVVVSKNRTDSEVRAVYAEGHRTFAENREQGLKARWDSTLPSDIEWHFVGPLQTRKIGFVSQHVDMLQSMDRFRLADKWSERSSTPVLVQFNMAAEAQKSGFPPTEAVPVLEELLARGIAVRGVMAIPPLSQDPEASRPYFRSLRSIFDTFAVLDPSITVCSMGMTNDLEIAIEEGATMVRVGRAIFV